MQSFIYVSALEHILLYIFSVLKTALGLKPQRIGDIKNSYWNLAFIHKNVSGFSVCGGIGTSKNYESHNFKGKLLEKTH